MKKTIERDIHILRYFSAVISVAQGRVINITDPQLTFCPLASHLYRGFKTAGQADKVALKREIKKAIESKIRDFGLFTPERRFLAGDLAVPYGASEMLKSALNKKAIEAAVIVCDGAGTVLTDNGSIVQGIGGRMNTLLMTSPIPEIIERLKQEGCRIVFENALIDQIKGVKLAIRSGYKKIAVTVCGHDADKLKTLRQLEAAGIQITILVVCTTGISDAAIQAIRGQADIVWSCASQEVRENIGPVALLQISKIIPIFVLTSRGIKFLAAFAQDASPLWELEQAKQYLISNDPQGHPIRLGNTNGYLCQKQLPALSKESFVFVNAQN